MSAFLSRFTEPSKMKYLYALRLLRELVNKLLVFYLPIYVFQIQIPFLSAWNLTQLQEGMLLVAFSYMVNEIFSFFSAIPVAQILLKRGVENGFILGQVLYGLFVVALLLSEQQALFLLIAMAIDGIQMSFFWNSYHFVLSRQSSSGRMGSNLGFLNFLLNLLAVISPALGGLIIASLGYRVLFLLGFVLILLALILAISFQSVPVRDKISWQEFLSWLKEPGFRRLAFSFWGRYANDAIITLWPLYVFLLWGSTQGVGALYSASMFLAMIIQYVAGPLLDKRDDKKPFYFSGAFLSVIWFLRVFVVRIWTVAVVDTFERLTASFHWLFFDRSWLLRGKGSQALSYFVYRQMLMAVFGVFFWFFVALLFLTFGHAWQFLFIFGAQSVLLTLLVQKHKGGSLFTPQSPVS
jgi:hypothetical protein